MANLNMFQSQAGADPVRSEAPCFVSIEAARQVLRWPEVIAKLSDVYTAPFEPMASPVRTMARANGSWVRTLTAVPPRCRFMGAKIFGVGPKFQVNYLIVLIEQESGLVRAIVDGALITAFRTAGTSAVAVNRILAQRPIRLGLIGSGDEARSHLDAIAATRTLSSVKIFSPSPVNRQRLADYCTGVLGVSATAVDSAEAAVRGAELVVAAARSHGEKPILLAPWLDNCAMVVSIGSTMQEQREVDVSVIDACDLIICDMVDEVAQETGDMIAAAAAGIEFGHKLVSLNDVMNGGVDARLASARLPMFKSVGAGVQDIAIAELVYERAMINKTACSLPMQFFIKQ
jgi:ornithine cyclodeaminase/alanine dehydrogenase